MHPLQAHWYLHCLSENEEKKNFFMNITTENTKKGNHRMKKCVLVIYFYISTSACDVQTAICC